MSYTFQPEPGVELWPLWLRIVLAPFLTPVVIYVARRDRRQFRG